jgi:hypothetical protein
MLLANSSSAAIRRFAKVITHNRRAMANPLLWRPAPISVYRACGFYDETS